MAADGNLTRRGSAFGNLRMHKVEESEFFAPDSGSAVSNSGSQGAAQRDGAPVPGRKAVGLANVAAREALLSNPLGGLVFSDSQIESDWQM